MSSSRAVAAIFVAALSLCLFRSSSSRAGAALPCVLVSVPGGSFTMGSADGYGDEKPPHEVTVGAFRIGATEVTQDQYSAVMGANPSEFRGGDLPVENVTWLDAVAFCNRLSERERLSPAYRLAGGEEVIENREAKGYRLPTEAEWEYAAARGAYAGAPDSAERVPKAAEPSDPDRVAWYSGNSGMMTRQVGAKAANALGLYDMAGNVWEWCWDRYGAYSSESGRDPRGPSSGANRVGRGGAWSSGPPLLRATSRCGFAPVERNGDIGFRIARDP
jgi:formylglycine-generating enzyme